MKELWESPFGSVKDCLISAAVWGYFVVMGFVLIFIGLEIGKGWLTSIGTASVQVGGFGGLVSLLMGVYVWFRLRLRTPRA